MSVSVMKEVYLYIRYLKSEMANLWLKESTITLADLVADYCRRG